MRVLAAYGWHKILSIDAERPMNERIERTKTSLEIEEDIDLHVKGWILQRIGWAFMLAFLIAAALGLFGDGILSEKKVSQDNITLTYQRYQRHQTDVELCIRTTRSRGELHIVLPAGFTSNFEIEKIVPEPVSQKIENGSVINVFVSEGEGEITFFMKPMKRGSVDTSLEVNGTRFALSHYIYP